MTKPWAIESVCESWNVEYHYFLHQNGWLIFKFVKDDDLHKVPASGPYMSNGKPWVLKQMPPFFSFNEVNFCSIPIWITLPGLPLECWCEDALSMIASEIRSPIATDAFTKDKSRPSFARILVEVDASKELVRRVPITLPNGKDIEQEVIFEFEPRFCTKYKRIGHEEVKCEMEKKPRRGVSRPRQPRETIRILVDARITKGRVDPKGKGVVEGAREIGAVIREGELMKMAVGGDNSVRGTREVGAVSGVSKEPAEGAVGDLQRAAGTGVGIDGRDGDKLLEGAAQLAENASQVGGLPDVLILDSNGVGMRVGVDMGAGNSLQAQGLVVENSWQLICSAAELLPQLAVMPTISTTVKEGNQAGGAVIGDSSMDQIDEEEARERSDVDKKKDECLLMAKPSQITLNNFFEGLANEEELEEGVAPRKRRANNNRGKAKKHRGGKVMARGSVNPSN